MPKSYEKRLRNSEDIDYIELADMNGKEVHYLTPTQVVVGADMLECYVKEADMMISVSFIKDKQYSEKNKYKRRMKKENSIGQYMADKNLDFMCGRGGKQ